tara:strand:+ start:482 stop:811 length:330 start_codon:yes stop_codon:yes gene_type:complete
MPFNSESGKKAGKLSKRGNALPVELRANLNELVAKIINDINYEELSSSQKIKLLDVALKYSLPKLSIQKNLTEFEEPTEIKISFVDDNGNVEKKNILLDDNFKFSDLAK